MGIFKKKKQETTAVEEPLVIKTPCEVFGHTYKDFPPYIEAVYGGKGYVSHIFMTESYVCTCCRDRINKTLDDYEFISFSMDKFNKELRHYEDKYKDFVTPRPIVEDMIQDAIMVDKEKLAAWEQLHGQGTKEEFKLIIPTENNDIGSLKPVIVES